MQTLLLAIANVAVHMAVLVPRSPVVPHAGGAAVLSALVALAAFALYCRWYVADVDDFIKRMASNSPPYILMFTLPGAFVSGAVGNLPAAQTAGWLFSAGTYMTIALVAIAAVAAVDYGFAVRRYDAHCASQGIPTFQTMYVSIGILEASFAALAGILYPAGGYVHYHIQFQFYCASLAALCIVYPLLAHYVWRRQMMVEHKDN